MKIYQNKKIIFQTKAYSKVNIGLNVYKKKKHELKHRIKSLFMLYKDLYDEISIYENDQLEIIYYMNNKKITLENDIVSRCLTYLKNNYHINTNYLIVINKQIPISSGLGGSSTDGASIMKYFIKKHQIKLTKKDYLKMCLELSSDLVFFISGYDLAIVSSYGNKIKPIYHHDLINLQVVLNNNKISTKQIYEMFDNYYKNHKLIKNNFSKIIKNLSCLKQCTIINNLEPLAFMINPGLKSLKESNRLLSGSGSSFIEWEV